MEIKKTVDISDIAAKLNMAYNMGNNQTVIALADTLFNEVSPRKQGGQALIKLSDNACQCVGLAFTILAMNLDFGDEDANSIAAENAYHCLARCYIENKNTFCLPAVFTVLNNRLNLLKDKLIASWCTMAQNQTGMPIGMMLGGNPYTDPRLKDFRNQDWFCIRY